MSRQARRPRRRYARPQPVPQTVVQVRGRAARQVTHAIRAQAQMQETTVKSAAFRYRHHLIPFWWALTVTLVSLAMHVAGVSAVACVVTGLTGAALILLFTRHLGKFAKKATAAEAVLTGIFVPWLALAGPRPALALLAPCWAVLNLAWARNYRARAAETPQPSRDEEIWEQLAGHKHWNARLGKPETIPGGVRYPVWCDGIRTHMGDIAAQPLAIAGAWHKPVTEAYVEPRFEDVASGSLTLLKRGTLQQVREWDGRPVSDDGFAVIGRYADGQDARICLFVRRDGTRHSIITGATGAGKSALLDLLVRQMLASGFIFPVILDPQNGQSLPQWRDRLLYAEGVEECMELLTLLHEGMMDRSRRMARLTWDDGGRTVRGMPSFDRELTGWPVVAVICDEHPVLLTDPKHGREAIRLTGEIGKLGRKTGEALLAVGQVPSLAEFGDQVVRAMLASGNIMALRSGERVSQGMLGLPADPYELPRYFPDHSPTYGLGYTIGPDNRQAVTRTDIPSAAQRRQEYPLASLEPEFAAILDRFRSSAPVPAPAPAVALARDDDDGAPDGRTAADAVLVVLTRRMHRDDILKAAGDLGVEWGREKPWKLRAVSDALRRLTEDGSISREGDGFYAPARAPLTLVNGGTQ